MAMSEVGEQRCGGRSESNIVVYTIRVIHLCYVYTVVHVCVCVWGASEHFFLPTLKVNSV